MRTASAMTARFALAPSLTLTLIVPPVTVTVPIVCQPLPASSKSAGVVV